MISLREDREQASRMTFNAATNDRRSGVPSKLFYSFNVVSLTGHVVIEKSRTLSSPAEQQDVNETTSICTTLLFLYVRFDCHGSSSDRRHWWLLKFYTCKRNLGARRKRLELKNGTAGTDGTKRLNNDSDESKSMPS
jgi:hypothetical protein